jgi:hypothetical protein
MNWSERVSVNGLGIFNQELASLSGFCGRAFRFDPLYHELLNLTKIDSLREGTVPYKNESGYLFLDWRVQFYERGCFRENLNGL